MWFDLSSIVEFENRKDYAGCGPDWINYGKMPVSIWGPRRGPNSEGEPLLRGTGKRLKDGRRQTHKNMGRKLSYSASSAPVVRQLNGGSILEEDEKWSPRMT